MPTGQVPRHRALGVLGIHMGVYEPSVALGSVSVTLLMTHDELQQAWDTILAVGMGLLSGKASGDGLSCWG